MTAFIKKAAKKMSLLATSLMAALSMACIAFATNETTADVAEAVSNGNSAMKRFYIVGGIALLVCIAFYVFLSIKTKKKKKK